MKKTVLKSFLLMFLIIGSIYQTGMLWFEDVSDRNFFYNFIDSEDNITNNGVSSNKYIIKPSMLAIYLGDSEKEYTVVKRTSKEYENLYKEVINLLKDTFNNGRYEDIEVSNEDLWKKRSILINLSFPLSKDIITDGLSVKRINADINYIKQLYIAPASLSDSNVKVYLTEHGTNKIYAYSVDKSIVNDINLNLNSFIALFESKSTSTYISTFKDNNSYFTNNVLIPLPSDNLMYKEEIYFTTPYINYEGFDIELLEQYVNGFFINPTIKWKIEKDNEIRFGDDSVIVKYNDEGIIEYTLINGSNESGQNVSEAYNIASRFLEKDSKLSEQEYYLDNYTVEEGKVTFYYNYGYDDFPIIMAEDNNYPMIITVSGGRVINYKRILLTNEEILRQRKPFRGKFEDAIDRFIENYNIESKNIKNMYLAYYWNEAKGYASMKWIIEHNNNRYIIDIE